MHPLTPKERRRRILLVCCGFARNLAIYQCGRRVGRSLLEKPEAKGFWQEINSSCLDIAILEWCKLFADGRGKHSWKRVVALDNQSVFERELMKAMALNSEQYAVYMAGMLDYRDKFIAHLDDQRALYIPFMGPARQAIWHLYGYLVENECRASDIPDLPDTTEKFENSYQHFVSQVEQVFIASL
jgi:hypothetical protein